MRETLVWARTLVCSKVSATTRCKVVGGSNKVSVQTIRRKEYCVVITNLMRDYKSINQNHGYYIAGFVDGEGSFNISLKKRKDYVGQWKLAASFNVSQKDRVILAFVKRVIGCGTLRTRKDGVVYYEVTNVVSLYENVLPFFKRFRFLSANKKRNLAIFEKIVKKMYFKEHLTREGFQEIVKLREALNHGIGRKRKYTLQNVQHTQ